MQFRSFIRQNSTIYCEISMVVDNLQCSSVWFSKTQVLQRTTLLIFEDQFLQVRECLAHMLWLFLATLTFLELVRGMMKLVVMPYVNFKWEFGESFLGKIQEPFFLTIKSWIWEICFYIKFVEDQIVRWIWMLFLYHVAKWQDTPSWSRREEFFRGSHTITR